ncbi:hypothetical protein BUZ69_04390 [Staphylococcus saprophyticus]|uniref:hypothetical protein n=1 Tax=Staphylococcus saprophyticus TaxID=29385 RepID=UPI000D1DF817|nr:hypothetical protein [Staphylococcus saprophyticus]PTK47079.1 hypothetical protein BUZ69_04390 [Staphylococcus saprophyticus]
MKVQLKLPIEFKDTVEGLTEVLDIETHTFKNWLNVDIEYTLVDVSKVADVVAELLKIVLEKTELVGTRVNDITFKVTKDNEDNLGAILKKLMV